ncbi:MAG: hypothetical protein HY747_09580 [Elusimicrobia bacterium]|nr:hypothetical protein [Elusimicrobiota bacterium]
MTNEDLTPSPFSSCQQVTNEDLTPSPSPAKAYFLESLGGCAAGLLATFVLIGKAPLFTSVVFGGLLIAI